MYSVVTNSHPLGDTAIFLRTWKSGVTDNKALHILQPWNQNFVKKRHNHNGNYVGRKMEEARLLGQLGKFDTKCFGQVNFLGIEVARLYTESSFAT